MPVEIRSVDDNALRAFFAEHRREALTTLWNFRVIWHEQRHAFAADVDGRLAGGVTLRIAASLAHVEWIVVAPEDRRHGLGRALLARAEETANYYNCHKMTLEVPNASPAQAFFEACGYKREAVLAQHTWKLDVAVLRKFLL